MPISKEKRRPTRQELQQSKTFVAIWQQGPLKGELIV